MPSQYDFQSLEIRLSELEQNVSKFVSSFDSITGKMTKSSLDEKEYGERAIIQRIEKITGSAKSEISSIYTDCLDTIKKAVKKSLGTIRKSASEAADYCDELNARLAVLDKLNKDFAAKRFNEVISTDISVSKYPEEIEQYVLLLRLESYDSICRASSDDVSPESYGSFRSYYLLCKDTNATRHLYSAAELLFNASYRLFSNNADCPYDILIYGIKSYKDIHDDRKEQFRANYDELYAKAADMFNSMCETAYNSFDYVKVKSLLNDARLFESRDIANPFFEGGDTSPEKLFSYAKSHSSSAQTDVMQIVLDDTLSLTEGENEKEFISFWLDLYDDYGFAFIKQIIDYYDDFFEIERAICDLLPGEIINTSKRGNLLFDLSNDYNERLKTISREVPLVKFVKTSVCWAELIRKTESPNDATEQTSYNKAVEQIDGLSYLMIVKYQKFCNCLDESLIGDLNIVLDESSNRLYCKPYRKDLVKTDRIIDNLDSLTVSLVSVQLRKKKRRIFWICFGSVLLMALIAAVILLVNRGKENGWFNKSDLPDQTSSSTEQTQSVEHTHVFSTVWAYNSSNHWHECSCGATDNVAAHSFGDWVVIKEPSTESYGEKALICKECGYRYEAIIPKVNHVHSSENSVWLIDETTHWHVCAECGVKLDETSHLYGEWTTVIVSTETATGEKRRTCSVCGHTEKASIPQLNHIHSFSSMWSFNDNTHWHECACGEKASVQEHSFGNWITKTTPTCSTKGSKESVCSICGNKKTASIEKTAHTVILIPAINATCTEKGKTEGSYCSICGTTISEQKEIKELGHNYVSIVTPPTATVDGFTIHTCSRCNYSFKDTFVKATGSIGLDYEAFNDETCQITGLGTCKDAEVIVPQEINGLKVISIKESAFANQLGITSLLLPDTVKYIGARALYGCNNLKHTNLPKSLMIIGDQAFFNSGIESLVISSDDYDYYGEGHPFTDLKLKGVVFNGTVIPAYACENCEELTSVTIQNTVAKIHGHAFSGCLSLKQIEIPNSITGIYRAAFAGSGLIEFTIPDSVTDLGEGVFSGCSNLQKVIISRSLSTINRTVFSWCDSLKTISLPDGITNIDDSAFWCCSALETIIIPRTVKRIGDRAFEQCTNLSCFSFGGTKEEWASIVLGVYWDSNAGNYEIRCKNGIIPKKQ